MPLDLAALLVEAATVTPRDMELALARQREAGGGLDTALLELELLVEGELVRFLSRASGLPPPPTGPIGVNEEAARVLPARVAERHRLAPFRLEGRELWLLAAHPVDLAVLDEISFMLSLHLVPHVAPEWRVRDLMARTYRIDLPDRFQALAARTGQAGAPAPGTIAGRWDLGRADPEEPLATALVRAVETLDASVLLREAIEPDPVPAEPPGWSRAEALAALGAARDRDEVVAAVLRFTRDFMEAAAVFGLARGRITGVDAVGWAEARARCRALDLASDGPGLVRAVLASRGPYLGPVAREAGNAALIAALGRPWPATALVYPVILGERPVCLVYADNGEAPASPSRMADLLLALGAVSGALGRVLRRAKSERATSATAEVEGGWRLREAGRLASLAASARPPPEVEAFRVVRASEALQQARREPGTGSHGPRGDPPDGHGRRDGDGP